MNDCTRATRVLNRQFSRRCVSPGPGDSVDNCQSLRRYQALEICGGQFRERARSRTSIDAYNVTVYSPSRFHCGRMSVPPTIRFRSALTNELRAVIAGFFRVHRSTVCACVHACVIDEKRICLFKRSIIVTITHLR